MYIEIYVLTVYGCTLVLIFQNNCRTLKYVVNILQILTCSNLIQQTLQRHS